MRNLIRADLYRIFRGKGVYITFAVLILYTVMRVFIMSGGTNPVTFEISIETGTQDTQLYPPAAAQEAEADCCVATGFYATLMGARTGETILFFLLPFIVFIAATDFSKGTVKNLLTSGTSRTKCFLTRLILIAAACLSIMLVHQLALFVTATIFNGVGALPGGSLSQYLLRFSRVFFPQLLIMFVCGCIGMFASFTFKSVAAVNTIYIAVLVLPFFVLGIVTGILDIAFYDLSERILNLTNYDLAQMMWLFGNNQVDTTSQLMWSLAVCAAWFVLTIGGGLFLFRKAEIK